MLLVSCVSPLFFWKTQHKSHDAGNQQSRLKTKRFALWEHYRLKTKNVALWVYYTKCIVCVWNGNDVNSDTRGGQRKIGAPLRQCSRLLLSIWDISINCALFVRFDWNRLFTEPLIPYEAYLARNHLRFITSSAVHSADFLPTTTTEPANLLSVNWEAKPVVWLGKVQLYSTFRSWLQFVNVWAYNCVCVSLWGVRLYSITCVNIKVLYLLKQNAVIYTCFVAAFVA